MEYLTLKELARRNHIAETTARRYINTFHDFFRPELEGQRTLYPVEDGKTLQRIGELYRQGMTATDIQNKLAQEFSLNIEPVEETYLPATERERSIQAQEKLAQAINDLVEQKAAIEAADQKAEKALEKTKDLSFECMNLEDDNKKLENRVEELEKKLEEISQPKSIMEKLKGVFKRN